MHVMVLQHTAQSRCLLLSLIITAESMNWEKNQSSRFAFIHFAAGPRSRSGLQGAAREPLCSVVSRWCEERRELQHGRARARPTLCTSRKHNDPGEPLQKTSSTTVLPTDAEINNLEETSSSSSSLAQHLWPCDRSNRRRRRRRRVLRWRL